MLAVHLNDEIVSYVLLLKIGNFKLNCSFESVSIREKTLNLDLFPSLLQELFQCGLKTKFEQNILEEDMRIWLTSVQELTPVT